MNIFCKNNLEPRSDLHFLLICVHLRSSVVSKFFLILALFIIGISPATAETELANPATRAREMEFVKEIHKRIVANSKETSEKAMEKYRVDLPALGKPLPWAPARPFLMLPIKGGTFTMGTPEGKGDPQESPAHTVTVDPFWMQQCEVTWNEYEPFVNREDPRLTSKAKINSLADAVAVPSLPDIAMYFGTDRRDGFPAISMSQHAANKYCQWLSARTGHFYRLPTEAEWEYACRAGTTTAYSFGDDPADLGKYGWFKDNSNERTQPVGSKLPNPWGLHDMHGNVAEWTLDGFAIYNKASAKNPWIKGTDTHPHVLRGGSWEDSAKWCRSAVRLPSDSAWNQDPQVPKSVWTLAKPTIGFRIVRPLKVPSPEEMFRYWNNEVEVDTRKTTRRNDASLNRYIVAALQRCSVAALQRCSVAALQRCSGLRRPHRATIHHSTMQRFNDSTIQRFNCLSLGLKARHVIARVQRVRRASPG